MRTCDKEVWLGFGGHDGGVKEYQSLIAKNTEDSHSPSYVENLWFTLSYDVPRLLF